MSSVVFFVALLAGLISSPAAHTDGTFTLAVAGDLLLTRGVANRAATEGWPAVLGPLTESLAGADATLINLESPLGICLPGGSVSRPRLCGRPEAAAALRNVGITAVSLANNHALDAGEAGLSTTTASMRSAGIVALGAEAARTGRASVERLGPIAIVSANLSRPAWAPGRDLPIPSPAEVAARIRAAHAASDETPILVVLHGGREMDLAPSDFERRYARAAASAGAAAVVFHGAHVVHPLTRMGDVPVHLGLGNVLFDQRDPRAAEGQIVLLRFRPHHLAEVSGIRCVDSRTGRLRGCVAVRAEPP